MTRIKYLLLTAICLVCAQAYGQSLLVYHVVGQVSYRVNGVSKPLVMNTKVTAQTSITVPYGGKVELLNEQSKQRVTIKQPGQGTIKQLSAARGNSVSQLSGKYRLRQEAARQQEPGLAETLHGLRDRDARTRLRGGGSTQAGALLRRPLQPV